MGSLPELQTEQVVVQLMPLLERTSLTGTLSSTQPQQNLSSATLVQTYINNTTILCMR